MANTSDIRKGLCIDWNNDIYSIVEFQHVKPGKGNAFVRTKLKSLKNGKVVDYTFPAGHSISPIRVERRKYQYLYNDETGYHFMNIETFEQSAIAEDMLGNAQLLKEGVEVEILFHAIQDIPLTVDLPQYVELEVTYTEPGDKGNTASSNVLKLATVETGAEIKVPLFINIGDKVKVETASGNYMERVKS